MSSNLELSEIVIHNEDQVVRFEDQNLEGLAGSSEQPFRHTRRPLLSQENGESSSLPIYATHAKFVNRSQRNRILDPNRPFLRRWNKRLLISCVLALAWDPLFFYVQIIDGEKACLKLDYKLRIIASVLRTLIDLFYLLRIILMFHTGLLSPSWTIRREKLVTDHAEIARRYLSSYFIVDILAVLPLPQMTVYVIIPNWNAAHLTSEGFLKLVIFTQYVPRLIRIYPIHKEVKRTSGLITETIWAGAAFNLFLYMLASHVVGSVWYLFAIDRQSGCWSKSCLGQDCYQLSLYCKDRHGVNYAFNNSYCALVDPGQITDFTAFNSGLFYDALRSKVVQSTQILKKLSYSFWWGLRNLSSCGQNLETSTLFGENVFAALICVGGLTLFALLIGNMQKYLQMLLSADRIEEEVRLKKQVIEQWMSRRLLPEDIRERIRRYEEYNWQETRGVNEESIMLDLPRDLRRDIKRHLCLDLLTRVPMFEDMDEQLLDAMCDRLKLVLHTENSYILREGDPVNEMLFIMKGKLLSTTTNVGRTGFFHSCILKAGDFFGEELLTWALDPHSYSNLPTSNRTIQSKTEVEAFAVLPDDLKFVATQFRRIHSKKLQHTFRFYSQQWKTWAACFIQVAWRRYCRRKLEKSFQEYAFTKEGGSSLSLGAAIYASRFVSKALRNLHHPKSENNPYTRIPQISKEPHLILQKPAEPDFNSEDG